jgi:parvulin-like peptidyl-prolyl isomerase
MIDNLLARYGVAQRALSDGMLGRDGLDAEILHKAVNSLFEAYVDRYVEARMLDDYEDQAREDYLMDPDRYKGSETATFRHLLVVPAKSGGEATAMEQVLELNDRIVENPGEFGSMIAEYSQDPLLAENGGNYEQIEPSMLEPRIVSTLEELEPGAISGPVRTQHGWHFVQLESWNEATVPDYEEVRQQYVDQARKDHRAEIHRGLINEMLSEDLELPEGAIAELLSRYGADAEVSNADLQTRS